jgi:F-type H+-transporting ATPase subunit b
MDIILHQLGELILTALPTFFLVIFLAFYLKSVFFKPLDKVLKQRYEVTEGARKLAEQSLERATAKIAEYEATLRAARAEIYKAQEQAFKEMQERSAAQIAEARTRADEAVREAKRQLAEDAEEAKASLAKNSDTLANQIVESILRRRAA